MLLEARPAAGLRAITGQARTSNMIFTQIPNLPARPIGFLRAELPGTNVAGAGCKPAVEKEAGRRDDNPSPPRYDRPGLVPGAAADERGNRSKSSAKQSHSKFHGAILSLTSALDSPGPES